MKTKEDFHKLIDSIENEQVLKSYYELISKLNSNETGKLWESLTQSEKEELLISVEESKDSNNWITHSEVKNQHIKWLKK
jgi:hypothetical protein